MHEHQFFVAVYFDREGRAHFDRFVRCFRGPFQVLGIVIATTDDNHILQTACDEQFAFVTKSQIARAEEFARMYLDQAVGRDLRAKGFGGRLLFVPIAAGNRIAADPDFADFIGPTNS